MLEDLDSAADIDRRVARLLRLADAGERLPTPVEDIAAAAGLVQTDEIVVSESMIKRAPKEMRRLLRSAERKIAGALDRRERVIQIAAIHTTGRQRFVACHEVAHDIFPWQRDLAVLGDDQKTLSPQVAATFEREANQGAAEILFQQDLLARIAKDYPIRISTPVELATLFEASIHATFRRWTESIDAAACGLVLDTKLTGGSRKRYEQVPTTRWQQQFGPRSFPEEMSAKRFPFASQHLPETIFEGTYLLTDLAGNPVKLKYETFSTPYRRGSPCSGSRNERASQPATAEHPSWRRNPASETHRPEQPANSRIRAQTGWRPPRSTSTAGVESVLA